MFNRLDILLRDDTPGPARTTPPRDERRRLDRPRDELRTTGHRREHDPRQPARTFGDRKRRATADVGMYRAVSYQDLSDKHFDGHPYATRRAVDQMVRRGQPGDQTSPRVPARGRAGRPDPAALGNE